MSLTNPTNFWKYVKNKIKTNGIIGSIKTTNKDGREIFVDNDQDKCSAFINLFSNAFTRDNFFDENKTVFEPCNTKMNSFVIDKETVKKIKK